MNIHFKNLNKILILLVFIYLAIGLYRIQAVPPPWHDEAYNLMMAENIACKHRIISDFDQYKFDNPCYIVGMPFHWILLSFLVKFKFCIIRYFYVLYGAATLLVTYFLARKLYTKKIATVAVALLVFNHLFFNVSRQILAEVPLTLLSVTAVLLFFNKNSISSIISGLLCGLAFQCHPIGLGAILSLGLISIYEKKYKTFLFLSSGFIIPSIPFIMFLVGNYSGYLDSIRIVAKEAYLHNSIMLNILSEIPVRFFSLPPAGDKWLFSVAWTIKNTNLAVYLCSNISKILFILSLAWLSFKKRDKIFWICVIYIAFLSLHPNKFGAYTYVIFPFLAICFSRFLSMQGRLISNTLLIFFIVVNGLFMYKQVTTDKIKDYFEFIEKVKTYVPRGATILAPRYFWIGLHKDYNFISTGVLIYKIAKEGKSGGDTSAMQNFIKENKIEYIFFTCHNSPDTNSVHRDIFQNFLDYTRANSKKITDFLRDKYYPDTTEDKPFPPPGVGFYNVNAEYQETLKIYQVTDSKEHGKGRI